MLRCQDVVAVERVRVGRRARKPTVSAMREETIERMKSIVGSDRDPLSVVVDMVLNDDLDVQTRLGAASIALPFLYPRLSETTVDARSTVVKIDGHALIAGKPGAAPDPSTPRWPRL